MSEALHRATTAARGEPMAPTPLAALQEAGALYGRGDWMGAERLCRTLLETQADSFEVLSLLGIIAAQTNRMTEAAELLQRAAAARPRDAMAHNNHGNALRSLGRCEEALQAYGRALALDPDDADLHYNRGNVLRDLKRHAEAADSYRRALAFRPEHVAACNNLGNAERDLGHFEEALRSYRRALAQQPANPETHNNLGNVLKDLGRFEEALQGYTRAVELRPDFAEACCNRANSLKQLRRLESALREYERALRLKPDYAEAHCNRGLALRDLGRLDEAVTSFERALELSPELAEAHVNRASALEHMQRFAEALAGYERAFALKPDCDWLHGPLLYNRMKLAAWGDLDACVTRLLDTVQRSSKVAAPFYLLAVSDSLTLQRQAAEAWVRDACCSGDPLPAMAKRERHDRIRLGYYSADFHNHATAYLAAELFELHDRSRFEVVAFSFGEPAQDEMRLRLLKGFDRFVDVSARSDREIAQLSRELEIDIAVDLKGFTAGARTGIFACRAAPLQVSYLGYPGTMGAPYIDYLIADPTLIPPESRPHYVEHLVYLPHSYQVNDRKRRIADRAFTRAELGLPADGFVFCCFNNTCKITPQTFDGWMRILRQVQGSVLWLLGDNPAAEINLRREAEQRGVAAERVVFAPCMPLAEHLARLRTADLFLDTLPYNAHTTGSDALWAGVPVLTCQGEAFVARVAASLLNAVGLPELITTTREQYEATAVELAMDRAGLTALRERLARNRMMAPLFDSRTFTGHLERAYEEMYARYQADLGPHTISVSG